MSDRNIVPPLGCAVIASAQEATLHLPDGRVLKGERTWFSVRVAAGGERYVSPKWRFTLDGEPIIQAEAEALISSLIAANPPPESEAE